MYNHRTDTPFPCTGRSDLPVRVAVITVRLPLTPEKRLGNMFAYPYPEAETLYLKFTGICIILGHEKVIPRNTEKR